MLIKVIFWTVLNFSGDFSKLSDTWHKESNIYSFRSPLVNEERMGPMDNLTGFDIVRVFFSALTQLGDRKSIQPLKNLFIYSVGKTGLMQAYL